MHFKDTTDHKKKAETKAKAKAKAKIIQSTKVTCACNIGAALACSHRNHRNTIQSIDANPLELKKRQLLKIGLARKKQRQKSSNQLVNWSTGQLVNWSTGQLINWSTDQST